jgi:succinate dehydrogenase / fumarate reductase iron-sulfur subunit
MYEKKEMTLRVFRFNAERDYLPAYKRYDLSVSKEEVMLDLLNRIKWEQDPTLSYRRSCRHGICGSCGIKVNGRAIVACKENVWHLAELYGNEMTIEPQDTRLAYKDLIIDKKRFWESYQAVTPWLEAPVEARPEKEHLIEPHYAERISEADHCIQCGSCFYSCPAVQVNEDYLGPAALALAYRFSADVRDKTHADRLRGVNHPGSGIWDCVKCVECSETCPKGVEPLTKIFALHNQTFREGVHQKNVATRHAVVFKHSIAKHGPLDEAENVRYSEGTLGALSHMREAFGMLRRGKLPLPGRVHKSQNHDEVKTLISVASENKF